MKTANHNPDRQWDEDKAHPLAVRAFNKLRHLTDADRSHVLRSILRLFGNPDDDRAAICIDAIRACAEAIGRVPSAGAYAKWRAEDLAANPKRHWPSKTYITETFQNSWSEAIAVLTGKFKPSLSWHGRQSMRKAITFEEAIVAIRLWLDELTVADSPYGIVLEAPGWTNDSIRALVKIPPAAAFELWAREARRIDPRIPSSLKSVQAACGTWRRGIAIANEGEGHSSLVKFLVEIAHASRDELFALAEPLIQSAVDHYGKKITQPQFDQWAMRRAAFLEDGPELWLLQTITAHRIAYIRTGWRGAVQEALGELNKHRDKTARVASAVVFAALRACAKDLGARPSRVQYRTWREASTLQQRLPNDVTVERRFLGWDNAIEAAFEGGAS